MKIYPQKFSVIALSCLFMLSACDKKNTNQTTTPTDASITNSMASIATTIATTSVSASANNQTITGITTQNSFSSSVYPKIMSTMLVGGILTAYADEKQLDANQRTCLIQADLSKAAPQLQAIFDQKQSAADKKAFDEIYSGQTGKQALDFTTQSIRFGMGLLGDQPPTLNPSDKAKIDAFNQSAPAQHIKTLIDEKQELTIILPIVNEQIKRCGFQEIPMQAILAQLPASNSQP